MKTEKKKPFHWSDAFPGVITPVTPVILPKKPKPTIKENNEEHIYTLIKGRCKYCLRDTWIYFSEFCFITQMHGIKYLAQNRSKIERFTWLIIILAALAGAIYMCLEMYAKYIHSPIVVTVSTNEIPVFKIPFPAVTICPEVKISAFSNFSYTDVVNKLLRNQTVTADEKLKFTRLATLCGKFHNETHKIKYDEKENYYGEKLYEVLDELKPDPKILFIRCKFNRHSYRDCSQMLTPVLTKEGICYTFNMIDRSLLFKDNVEFHGNFFKAAANYSNWDVETGYEDVENETTTYPRRGFHSKAESSFAVTMAIVNKDENLCKYYKQGYRVHIHSPYQIPRPNINFFHVPYGSFVSAAIEPEYQTTSKEVSAFPKEKRKCVFEKEKKLDLFKHYDQNNCITECVTRSIVRECNCTKFYLPRTKGTRICGIGKLNCVKQSQVKLRHRQIDMQLRSLKDPSVKPECDCAPRCTRLSFTTKVSQSSWNFMPYLRDGQRYLLHNITVTKNVSLSDVQMSRLIIYYDRQQYTMLERNQIYGLSDLISNFGGLLGLFTGISLITLVEVLYYLTIRIWGNVRIYGKWNGSPSAQ